MFCARAEKVAPPGFRRRSSAVSVIASCPQYREEVLEVYDTAADVRIAAPVEQVLPAVRDQIR